MSWDSDWRDALGELELALEDRETLGEGITLDESLLVKILRDDEGFGPASVREVARRLKAGTEAIERARGLA